MTSQLETTAKSGPLTRHILNPFTTHPHVVAILFTLMFPLPAWICLDWLSRGLYGIVPCTLNLFLLFGHSILVIWITLGIAYLLSGKLSVLKWIWISFVIILQIFNLCGNIFAAVIFSSFPGSAVAAMVAGSNPAEVVEFIGFFLQNYYAKTLIILLCLAVFYLLFNLLWTKIYKFIITGLICAVSAIMWCVMIAFSFHGDVRNACEYGKINLLLNASEFPGLTDEGRPLSFQPDAESRPDYVFIIIGESFAKDNSSLYGYEKTTNPQLGKLRDDSLLMVFTNARSEAVTTLKSFSRFFTARRDEMPWYECENPYEIAEHCGFSSAWISNQAQKGFSENPISKLANRADTAIYTTAKTDVFSTPYDDEVIPLLDFAMRPDTSQLIFVHLQGSHFDQNTRFPPSRRRFVADDYKKYPTVQREARAAYDNSVLFNDSVVAEIFKRVEKMGGIAIYFPDHGEDVCVTTDVIKHGNPDDERSIEAATRIPFMIYLSRAYRDTHPVMRERIEASLDEPVSNTQMIYTLMDFLGVDFADRPVVDSLSAIRPLSHNINQ